VDKIEYTPIVIHSDRKTIAIEIGKKGVIVRAPNRMSEDAVVSFLKQKEDWIQKSLLKMASNQSSIANLPKLTKTEINSLADRALKVIPVKVKHYAKQLNVDYGRITIRCQRTRWGSCSSAGNLNFNCLLMLMPDEVIDSVVAHELCHRKQMNHSAAFYAELYKVFPDYDRCRHWLKKNGRQYLNRLS
jgi:predicted metal-dependent hydrolase